MGLKDIFWSESRSAVVNLLIIFFVFIVFMIAISWIAGVFGLAWLQFTRWLGLGDITIEQAIGYFGSPSALIEWLDAWLRWAASVAYEFFVWLGNGILYALGIQNAGDSAAAAAGGTAVGGGIAAGGTAKYINQE